MSKILTLLFLVILGAQCSADGQAIQPIDSLYLGSLPQFSKNIENIREKVWPGMTMGPYCIFRIGGPAFLKNHPNPPAKAKLLKDSIYQFSQADFALLGTSQTEINNHLTAHNNYGQSFYVSENQFYAEVFHELHHVYQRNYIKKLKFDNPAELLTYPENFQNDAIRQYEDELLLSALTGPTQQLKENLNKFFSCRALRQTIIGEKYLNYEKDVESCEGPATYCEYMYMKEFSSTEKEQEYIHKRFFYSLIEPAYGREGLRNKRLLSGMVQCLLLAKHFTNWQHEYYNSGQSLSDYFFTKFKPQQVKLPALDSYEARAKYFTAMETAKHIANIQSFNNQGGLKITVQFKSPPEFRGFDPMHAEAINDSLIIHSTLLKLGKGANYFTAANERAITKVNGSVWTVRSLTFFVSEDRISLENNTLTYKGQNISVSWQYSSQKKEGNEYIVTVD
jgi:hypothetical protein